MRRYIKTSINDHKTWLFSSAPAGYSVNATWWASGATPRLGYERFGNKLKKADVLAAAYNTHFLDNGVVRVDFNKIWGNAIGKITQLSSGKQIARESIGDMVQTVVRFGGGAGCTIPNPTQSGGAHCNTNAAPQTYRLTERWAGSSVISTTKIPANPLRTDPQTLTSVVRPLEFCHNGQVMNTTPWPGADPLSPLAWRGFMERSDTLTCRLLGTGRKDVVKTSSRIKLGEGSGISSNIGNTLNTHWLEESVIGDARVAGAVVVEEVNLTTGAVTPVTVSWNGSQILLDGATRYVRQNMANSTALMISNNTRGFGYAVAKLNPRPDDELALEFRCTTDCEPANVAVIVQVNRTADSYSTNAWSTPQESFLVVNNRSSMLTRLNEIYADGGDCLN
jgi:hypothetical protein